jgi:hypothetical protein
LARSTSFRFSAATAIEPRPCIERAHPVHQHPLCEVETIARDSISSIEFVVKARFSARRTTRP